MDTLGQGGRGYHHVEELLPEQHLGRVPHLGVVSRVVPRDTILHGALAEEQIIDNSRICSDVDLEEGLGGGEVVVDVLSVIIPEGVAGHQGVLRELSEDRVQLYLEDEHD